MADFARFAQYTMLNPKQREYCLEHALHGVQGFSLLQGLPATEKTKTAITLSWYMGQLRQGYPSRRLRTLCTAPTNVAADVPCLAMIEAVMSSQTEVSPNMVRILDSMIIFLTFRVSNQLGEDEHPSDICAFIRAVRENDDSIHG